MMTCFHRLLFNKKVFWTGAVLVVLAVAWRAVFLWISVDRICVSGDEAIMGLQGMGLTQSADNPLFQTKQNPAGVWGRFPLLFMAQPYLFPFESYLMAPFIRWLPHTALGLRLIPALMGLVGVLAGLWLLRRWQTQAGKARGGGWCSLGPLALVVFPSAYVLTLQSAYMLPSYPGLMMLSMLTLLAGDYARASRCWWNPLPALLAGGLAGLTSSNSLMALPLLGAVAVAVSFSGVWRKTLVAAPSYLAGAAAGLAPWYVAKQLYPGAHAAVTTLVPWQVALERLQGDALRFTLPVTLGFRATEMPDAPLVAGLLPESCLPGAALCWLVLMAVLTVICVVCVICRSIRARWPDVHLGDILVGLCWVYPVVFSLSSRYDPGAYRYLLPVALFLPLVLGWGMIQAPRRLAQAFGVTALVLLVVNLGTSVALARAWIDPAFDGHFTDTRPAIEYLEERGIERCYSSYFDVYSINFLSGESIVCSQPYNERFFGWPYPYADLVDSATNVAYVLGPGPRFQRGHFEHDMEHNGVTYRMVERGKCRIYTDFVNASPHSDVRVPHEAVGVAVSHYPEDAPSLADGVLTHKWRSRHAQQSGMWIRLQLDRPVRLSRLRFYYNGYHHDHARSLDVYGIVDGEKKMLAENWAFDLDPFVFVNDHPVYSWQVQELTLEESIETNELMIEINSENPGRDWTIGEIELYEVAEGS
jgi:hypothetical protein